MTGRVRCARRLRWQKTSPSRSLGSAPSMRRSRARRAQGDGGRDPGQAGYAAGSAARLRTLIAAAVDLAEQADELVERLDELLAADRT